MNQKPEYLRVLRLYGRCIESLTGWKPSDQRLVDGQSLALKLFEHAAAIYSLADGTPSEPMLGKQGALLLVSSMNVLTRAALETYLLFHHVFVDPQPDDDDDDEFEFRYCAWRLSELSKREQFKDTFGPQTPKEKAFARDQHKLLETLRERVQKTEQFATHSSKTQRKLLTKGKWRFPGWTKLAVQAGLGPVFSAAWYSLLSGHTHSGALAAQQMSDVWSLKDREESVQDILRMVQMIVSRMITTYVERFPDAKQALANDPETTIQVQIWSQALENVP